MSLTGNICWFKSNLVPSRLRPPRRTALNEGLTDYELTCMNDGVICLFSVELCYASLLIRKDWDDKEVEERGHFAVLSHTVLPPRTPLSCISVTLASYFKDHIETWDCLAQSWPSPSSLGFTKDGGGSPPPSFFFFYCNLSNHSSW